MEGIEDLKSKLETLRKERDNRLQEIKAKEDKKLKRISDKIKEAQARQSKQDRKDNTRLKIILGGIILKEMKDDNLSHYIKFVGEKDKQFVQENLEKYRAMARKSIDE
jgi:predicted proteasome-type protease